MCYDNGQGLASREKDLEERERLGILRFEAKKKSDSGVLPPKILFTAFFPGGWWLLIEYPQLCRTRVIMSRMKRKMMKVCCVRLRGAG